MITALDDDDVDLLRDVVEFLRRVRRPAFKNQRHGCPQGPWRKRNDLSGIRVQLLSLATRLEWIVAEKGAERERFRKEMREAKALLQEWEL